MVKSDYSVLHGPAWANINWLLIDGLKRNSHGDVVEELRKSTVSAIETEGSAECFDLVTGEGRGGLRFSCTAAAYMWLMNLGDDLEKTSHWGESLAS